MVGILNRCWIFNYHTTPKEAQKHLPPGLEPITHHGHAFWGVVVSQVKAMRPRHFPSFTGVGYWHVGYRLHVRFHPSEGEPLEGIYFVRSDASSPLMTTAGNLMTRFQFHTAKINIQDSGKSVEIKIESESAPAHARIHRVQPTLPTHSAFATLREAHQFLQYEPRGISIEPNGDANIVQITRNEDDWRSTLVEAEEAHWSFFKDKEVHAEICYEVDPIAYQWNRGTLHHISGKALHQCRVS